MAKKSLSRVSALEGYYHTGRFGVSSRLIEEPGIIFQERSELQLWQVAAWPETFSAVATRLSQQAGAERPPSAGQVVVGAKAVLLRAEPLKFWVLGARPPALSSEEGAVLDQSHSRSLLSVSGSQATALLNRHLPIDLREDKFPLNSFASTAFHHVGVSLWRSEQAYELFMPRSFAVSLWEMLQQSAAQFSYETLESIPLSVST